MSVLHNVLKIVIFGLLFAGSLTPAIQAFLAYEKAKTYTATQGTVSDIAGNSAQDADLSFTQRRCRVEYQYTVKGIRYVGDTISVEQQSAPQKVKCIEFLEKLDPQVGHKIEVYYDPELPSDSLAYRGFPIYSVKTGVVYSFFLIGVLFLMSRMRKYVKENTIETYQ